MRLAASGRAALGLAIALSLGGGAASAQTVTAGQQPRTADIAAVRFKSLANTGSSEIYLGVPDVGLGSHRTETNATWVNGANDVTFTLDVANNKLVATISNTHPSSPFVVEYPNLSSQIAALAGPTYGIDDVRMMEIGLRLGHASGTLSFDTVAIDGNPLGSFPGVLSTWQYWTVTDYDFYDGGAGFTLSGTVQRGGTFAGGDEATKIEIVLGVSECGNSAVEAGEDCDDGNTDPGDCCSPQCGFESGACSDGSVCTSGDACDGAGSCVPGGALDCDDGTACTADSCDPGSGCQHVGAPAAPCAQAGRAVLLIRDESVGDVKDRLLFKWTRSLAPPTTAQLAEPTTTAGYSLCVYAGTSASVVTAADVAPGIGWSAIGAKGFRFRDAAAAQDGVRRVLLKSEIARKPRAIVRGRGPNVPEVSPGALPLVASDFPLRAQLINTATGLCLEASFSQAQTKRNTATRLRAKFRN